jgi:hypothetical protein
MKTLKTILLSCGAAILAMLLMVIVQWVFNISNNLDFFIGFITAMVFEKTQVYLEDNLK